ncbi:MAG TPA: glycosyltransferase family 4 protein [Ktedonobacteraceae bacterium]|nr:glycosyltransferase family 4 protein [Ktedonobacteraceae bacterium]
MKTLIQASSSKASGSQRQQRPLQVCMYRLGSFRIDIRAKRIASALLAKGHTVTVFDIETARTCPVEEMQDGVRVQHLIEPFWYIARRWEPWFFIEAARNFVRSVKELIKTPADIYHACDVTALPASYIAAVLRRKPLILDMYELPVPVPETRIAFWRWTGRFFAYLLRLTLPRCAQVFSVSPGCAQTLRHVCHLSNIQVLRNVPEYRCVEKSERLRQQLNLPAGTGIALYQGNIQPDRGLEILVRAAPFLKDGNVIVIMGQGVKDTVCQLQSLITQEGLGDRVKLLPPVPYAELLDWTASADIGLTLFSPDHSLSIRYCLPNKFFEYLMAGLPVLSSSLDDIETAIKAYDVGQVVPSLTPAAVGAAINALLADRDALARMSQNALRAAREELNWQRESAHLLQLYHEACNAWSLAGGQHHPTSGETVKLSSCAARRFML